ncbi:FprA family A-type flavoprotein [candidate division KSB1 bacterium]
MSVRKLKKDIYAVGSIDWDRELFDALIPLSEGTSYNSYLIIGSEKTALIDTVDPSKEQDLLDNLKKLNVSKIDYVISNHAEQDHSGTIPKILEHYPEAQVVTNRRCKEFLMDLLLVKEEKFRTVEDRETLSLGNKTLQFILTPWVHWPETMVTYLKEDRILFSCDFFGSHFATSDLFVKDNNKVYDPAKIYYAEIMMPFRAVIIKNLQKLEDFEFEMIAPSHGPVYKDTDFIIKTYKDWVSDSVKNEVVVPYISMHGSTSTMINYFLNSLIEKGVTVTPFNISQTDIGKLSMALVDAATVVIGSPTVLAAAHPTIIYAVSLVNALKPKFKFASVIGSYSWKGKMLEQIKDNLSNLKFELLPPVIAKGHPKDVDFKELDRLVNDIVDRHKSINLM